ncbi:MAG TPA: 2-hydroxychromene-2-carboxylate isomerase [Henriciella marina]|uniref:2-hydroxychromene-2-carboxylate isomerase n=1 Tax=Henriciella sp. TaxID=1968823 RepID=UPI00179D05E1|nr:DsbA family protein [Henriciella sp.]HIG22157.1 2-hydroxychromene-2-carboxylate isomerase [Henriciella sp.]HIK65852.1 2-hydroxychromene-2-carboxylate isomerase [Henriciella marina]
MTAKIDVFWSFRSPYSRLVVPDLLKLREDFQVDIALRPVLPLAIRNPEALFDANDRRAPMYIVRDSMRRGEMLGRPVVYPLRPDPIVQDFTTMKVAEEQPYIHRLTKLGVEANRRGKGLEMAGHVSALIFGGGEDWDKGAKLGDAVSQAGLDLAELDEAIENGDHEAEIERNQAALDASGHWGVPTMVFEDEPFFGQDRVDTLRWRLEKSGVPKR